MSPCFCLQCGYPRATSPGVECSTCVAERIAEQAKWESSSSEGSDR